EVLTNLLNNSAKYTDPGGHISLTLQREGGEAVLRVRDTGIGIAAEMLPRIFDLFVQVERRLSRSQGGVGIGLTLVKKLIELHGGTVEALSAGVGRGSQFVVRLPAAANTLPPRRETVPNRIARPPGRRNIREDGNPDAAESLAMFLRLIGQEAKVAYDGMTALELARQFQPEIMFLDLGMPGMDGYEVARRLRRDKALQGTLLVALTGYGQEDDR